MFMSKLSTRLVSLVVLLFLSTYLLSAEGNIKFKQTKKTVLTVTVDNRPVRVNWYAGPYVTRPNREEDQRINVYVPEGATKSSPIIFIVNNGGWQFNTYPANTIQGGEEYDGTNDKIGTALKERYVIVSYGARGRNNGLTDGKYLGHSPSTMTDTKAAIRYLRYNKKALPAGDTDRIVVTGISGGGALSTLIAASGNSADFFPSLFEIGAAGITRNSDGTYSSQDGVGDEVFAAISYCPITDLGHGDAAYEWLFRDVRQALYMAGKMSYDYADEETVMQASRELSDIYGEYIDHLGLKDESGRPLNSSNLSAFIERLMKKEIELSVKEIGIEQMKKDVEQEIRQRGFGGGGPMGGGPQGRPQANPRQSLPDAALQSPAAQHRENNGWITFSEDGTWKYNLKKHLYYLALYTTLKAAPSFSNFGLYGIGMNEDNLFGSEQDEYSPFNSYSWNHDSRKNHVGKDDTGLSWDEFIKTEEGKNLMLEAKMTCAMDYILEGKSDTAPYWYVRHGMDDRDASFAVEATLFSSIMNSEKVKGYNVGFAWLKGHAGDYDVPEAYGWLKEKLKRGH